VNGAPLWSSLAILVDAGLRRGDPPKGDAPTSLGKSALMNGGLPQLGRRGEDWGALELVLLAAIVAAGIRVKLRREVGESVEDVLGAWTTRPWR
jgi:hypothetical protein